MTNKLLPKVPISDIQIGAIKNGNEGSKWIVINNKKKKEWLQLYGRIKKFKTHDNGRHPFYVIITDEIIIIFKYIHTEKDTDEIWSCHTIIHKYKKVFIGKNMQKYTSCLNFGSFTGNSILIELKNLHYMYIGNSLITFKTTEPIVKYYSTMGNNDVPYPFALSENFVYIMLDMFKSERVRGDPNPYPSFFGHIENPLYKTFKHFPKKTLVKRQY